MFTSHLSDARLQPILRQPSVDSLGPRPTTSTTESSCSSFSSHTGMQSPEQPKFHQGRRTSVFTLRSRSNTATSTTPSSLSSSQTHMSDPDEAWHDAASQSDVSKIRARRSFFRGRIGKRLSESVDANVNVMEYVEREATEKRASILRKGKKHSHQSSSDLKHQISSPFDFQHVSHADRQQMSVFERAASDKTGAELWAINAPHHSNHGVLRDNVDHLHFSNFSSENLESAVDRSPSALGFGSPAYNPESPRDLDHFRLARAPRPPLRSVRSVDSFSQPGVSPRKQQHSQSVTSLPRLSSRIQQGQESANSRGSSRSKRESGVWEHFANPGIKTPDQLAGIKEDSSYFGHAFTTPDDTAIHAMTPPFSPRLADVAEEPERFVSPRPAPPPPTTKTPASPKLPFSEEPASALRNSPVAKQRSRGQSHSSPPSRRNSATRPLSQSSDTLGSYRISRRESVRRPSAARRKSNTWRAIEESWEDDVDYIYDNALEADCDFEWDQASEHQKTRATSSVTGSEFTANDSSSSCGFRASLLVPYSGSMPELVPTSAISTSTMSAGVSTPHDSFDAQRFNSENGYVLTPSLLIPAEYKDNEEVSYEDLLNEYEGSDRHIPLLDARASMISSTRSSHARFSRRSSYDSSLVSSIQSSGTWSSPVRRSASSAGSVPELVPSRRSRKDLGFSLMIDQLSEQVASLRQLNEDDEDTTPPGQAVEERTFFSSEDESTGNEQPQSSLENDLKASLELARQGAEQNSTLVRQHRPALSESAARLMSNASETTKDSSIKRNRAGTNTQGKQPMLSLFPTPPRSTTNTTR